MTATFAPTVRAGDLTGGPLRAYLNRMGLPSLPSYLVYAVLTGLAQRRRGLVGIALRKALYRFLVPGAEKAMLLEDVDLRGPARIRLGAGVMIEQRVLLDAKTDAPVGIDLGTGTAIRVGTLIDTGYNGWVTVGAGSTLGAYCELRGSGGLTIGRECLFARNVMIVTSEHVMDDPTVAITDQGILTRPTVIGDGVWIGANVLVRAGVTIGAGAVVGANSVVTRDVPGGGVVVGAPAALLRVREGYPDVLSRA